MQRWRKYAKFKLSFILMVTGMTRYGGLQYEILYDKMWEWNPIFVRSNCLACQGMKANVD